MKADFYETETDRSQNKKIGRPNIGIGQGTVIECAIIDKNARIGRNVRIRCLPDRPDSETGSWVVRDGLVVVPKDAVIPDNTVT